MGTLSGIVKEDGSPVGGRIVRAYRRDTGVLLGATVSSDGLPVPGDAYLSDRVMLVRGDGTSIVDECPTPRSITVVGNTSIVDGATAFGGRAIYFDGAGDYLYADSHASLAFGTGDFTIEMRIHPSSLSGDKMLIDFRPTGTNGAYPCIYLNGSTIAYYVASVECISGSHGMTTLTGFDVLLCRKSGVTRLFVNGVQIGAAYTDSTNYLVGTSRPLIGANGFVLSASNYYGLIGKIRISRRADLDADFKPIVQPFYTTPPAAATPIGTYSIATSHAGEVQVVCLDDAAGATYNDQIARTTPV